MRVVILSSTLFGYRCIVEGILPLSGVQIAGILTTPKQIQISYSEKPVEIKTHADFTPLADSAECEVAVLTGKVDGNAYLRYLNEWAVDFILALGWYYMVPRKVRNAVPLGCAGIHASLLPKYRGGAPIPWAIINGENETGVSFFYFEDGVDDGDIIGQKRFPIDDSETWVDVYNKAEDASVDLLGTFLPKIKDGSAPRIAQNHELATYVDQRKPQDGLISWRSMKAREAYNFIRAQVPPYPGAFSVLGDMKVIFSKVCQPFWEDNGKRIAGQFYNIHSVPNTFGVCCADGVTLPVNEVILVKGNEETVCSAEEFMRSYNSSVDSFMFCEV